MARSIQLAHTFHQMAEPFLSEMGFALQNDPNKLEHYCSTRAIYKTQEGFHLWVGLDPIDGRSAGITCGRSWNYSSDVPGLRRFQYLSHRCYVLAKRLGVELSEYYELDVHKVDYSDLREILEDLEGNLPTILDRTMLEDLIAVEQEQGGAKWWQEHDGHRGTRIRFEGITPFVSRRISD